MCLYLTSSEPKVAKKKVRCYKILLKDMTSPFFPKHYYLGATETSVLGRNFQAIQEGLHTYSDLEQATKAYDDYYTKKFGKGCVLVECFIPEGGTYYVGTSECNPYPDDVLILDSYASDKLLLNKIIKH